MLGHLFAPPLRVAVVGVGLIAVGLLSLATDSVAQTPPADVSASPSPAPDLSAVDVSQVFTWLSLEGGLQADWAKGAFFFVLGLVGAAVTLYLFAGEMLPSMGTGRLRILEEKAKTWEQRREEALTAHGKAAKSDDVADNMVARLRDHYDRIDEEVDQLEKQVTRERTSLLRLATPLYLLLGGFFAAMFATSLLQAALIGFGWTAIAERIGLKRQQEELKESRGEEISKLETAAADRAEYIQQLTEAVRKVVDEQADLIRQRNRLGEIIDEMRPEREKLLRRMGDGEPR